MKLDAPVAAAARACYEAALDDGWAGRNFPLLAAWRVLRERKSAASDRNGARAGLGRSGSGAAAFNASRSHKRSHHVR